MAPFFLAGTAFLRLTLPGLPHPAGSRTSPARVPSLITVGCLGFPPDQRATARSDECPVRAPGDLHGSQEFHDFIASSVRNHDIPNQADEVVGFGNALCQDIAERHVPGKEVSLARLSQARSSPTDQIVFDPPVSEHFFKAVREGKSQRPGSTFIGLLSKRMVYNLRIPTAPFRSLFP